MKNPAIRTVGRLIDNLADSVNPRGFFLELDCVPLLKLKLDQGPKCVPAHGLAHDLGVAQYFTTGGNVFASATQAATCSGEGRRRTNRFSSLVLARAA